MADHTSNPKITLKSGDGVVFDVEEAVAMELQTVKTFIEDNNPDQGSDFVIPLPNVRSWALERVIDYCKTHLEFRVRIKPDLYDDETKAESLTAFINELKAYDENFRKDLNNDELKEVALAANYLDAKEMLGFLNQILADRIRNKSVEYVRSFFGLDRDYTTDEERQLREENQWAFENVDDE